MQGQLLRSRYRILQYLAKGGFGKTYLAEDTLLPGDNRCVVKQLYLAVDNPKILETARRLFKKEAETLKKLGSYDRIPQLLASFEEEQKFYLVQQYIDGHTLKQELVPGQTWTEAKVIEFCQDCLQILDFIHAQGIIHRDVKPDNLIRRRQDNKLVLVDFGTVKEIISAQTQMMTSTVAVGTKGYMPMEQAMGKPRINSDIYALGTIAIQALMGVHPLQFQEDDNGEIIWQSQANVSSQLAAILSKMVRYHFQDRYQSAREVLEELDRLDINAAQISDSVRGSRVKRAVEEVASPTVNYRLEETFRDASLPATASKSLSQENTAPLTKSDRSGSSENSQTNFVAKLSNLIRSATGTTVGRALIIGSIATGGLYLFDRQMIARREKEVENIVSNLSNLYENQKYQDCYDQAENQQTQAAGVSERVIEEWLGKCGLGVAQKKAEIDDYASAIAIAEKLDNVPNQEKVRQYIDDWSNKILEVATATYKEKGNLAEATQMILTTIPEDSAVRKKALDLKQTWETENEINKKLIATANQALAEKRWQEAKSEAEKVSGSDYWQQQAKAVIDEADKAIESSIPPQPKPTRATPNYSNQNRASTARKNSNQTNSGGVAAPVPKQPAPTPSKPSEPKFGTMPLEKFGESSSPTNMPGDDSDWAL